MSDTAGPTSKLCQWVVATRHQDLPKEVRQEAVAVLHDQIGCMVASATLPTCQPVVDLVRRIDSGGECSIIGHPVHASVLGAALANGTIGHGDEVDSTGQQGTGHFAAAIIPTALTVGQFVKASGTELVRAIALGAEVGGRFVSVLAHYNTRPQFGACVGHTMGATVTAGVLLGLDADKLEHALGLAASGACGLDSHHKEELHQIKSLEFGRSVEQGTLSALLAQGGFHGPREIMSVEYGFFDAFLGLPSAANDVMKGLGEEFLMRTVAYKRYSVGGPDQTPLYAFLKLYRANKLTADDIEQIEVSMSRGGFTTVTTNRHPSVYLRTILSMAAVYGDITFAHVHEDRWQEDARVKAFLERARIFAIPRTGAETKGERLQSSMTIRTRDGRVLTDVMRFPSMTEAELESKFHKLMGMRFDAARVDDLEKRIKGVEAEKNVASLIKELEVPYQAAEAKRKVTA